MSIENNYEETIFELAKQCYTKFKFYPISLSNLKDTLNNMERDLVSITPIDAWDTIEILKTINRGKIPIYKSIDFCPEYTMIHHPKKLLKEISLKSNRLLNEIELYNTYNNKLINYYNKYLSNDFMVKYIFKLINIETPKNILFIDTSLQYSIDSLSYQVLYDILYNKKINTDIISTSNFINEDINNKIKNKFYDLVIYGNVSKSIDNLDEVIKYYKQNEIVGLYPNDINANNNILCNRLKSYICLFVKEIFNTIDFVYTLQIKTKSDINEHLETLFKYASNCESIIELGVRNIVSSWAFARGLINNNSNKKVLLMNDIEYCDADNFILEVNNYGISANFIQKNDLELEINETYDMTFIDTWHIYGQLKRELEKFSKITKKYIIMHDTTVDEVYGESVRLNCNIKKQSEESGFSEIEIIKGLGPAWIEFLAEHPEWRLKERFFNNNGLTILERKNLI
jgi:hypothetical protein